MQIPGYKWNTMMVADGLVSYGIKGVCHNHDESGGWLLSVVLQRHG